MLVLNDFESLKSPFSPLERFGAPNAKSVGEWEDECESVMVDANVLLLLVLVLVLARASVLVGVTDSRR